MDKQLEIIEAQEDRQMFQEVSNFLSKFKTGHTAIQIHEFILNDIEFPTDYGKWQQAKVELLSRYQRVVDAYYELKKLDIELRRKKRLLDATEDDLDKELYALEIEQSTLRYESQKFQLRDLVREAKEFYGVYMQFPDFHDMTDEQEFEKEKEQWALKAWNNPLIFEERYGKEFLVKAWGEDVYNKFLEARKEATGHLPREIMD